jgi:FMN phosphatase YigB (HAD superfamily)
MTNGFADVQHARIRRLGLEGVFDHVIISEEVGVAKPDPGVFDIAFERMGNPDKARVLMVGDSLSSDIVGGFHYGIDTCWFNPDGLANLTGNIPTYEIRHIHELLGFLETAEGTQ